MPFILSLLPLIFPLAEKVFGSVIDDTAKASIVSKIGGSVLGQGFEKIVSGAFSSVLGTIASDKQHEFELELASLTGQLNLDQQEEVSRFNPREFVFWGVGLNLVTHYTLVNIISILNSLVGCHITSIPPLDTMFLIISTGLLGLHMATSTIEKLNT